MAAPTLDNNPRLIDPSRNLTPDQRVAQEASARRVAEAAQRIPDPPADLQTLEEVVVTAPRELNPYAENFLQTRGDYYQALMLSNWSSQQRVSQPDTQRPYQLEQTLGMLRVPQGVARAIRSVQETAHSIQQAFEHPAQALLGAGKTIANIVPETLELFARGDLEQQQSVAYLSDAMFGTNNADFLAQVQGSFELPKFSFSNPAQEGGALLFDVGSLAFGGLLAAPGRASAIGRLGAGLDIVPTDELGMFRRVANQGAFAELPILMDLKTVRRYATDAGVGLDGVKVRIVRDESLVGKGLYGYTSPNGKSFDLYPDAFSSPEELVRTLGHERTHIYQIRTFGRTDSTLDLRLNENAAYGLEDSFVEFWRSNGGL